MMRNDAFQVPISISAFSKPIITYFMFADTKKVIIKPKAHLHDFRIPTQNYTHQFFGLKVMGNSFGILVAANVFGSR